MLGPAGHHLQGRRPQDRGRPRPGAGGDREGRVRLLARARRRAHERREPARGADRRARRPAAYGTLAQRPGGDRFQALPARLDRWRGCGAGGSAARACAKGGDALRSRHAGLHPSAAGAARHFRPSPARLRRDAGARPWPLRRCARAAQRVPAGLGSAGRDVVPDRSAQDRRGAWASTGRPPIRSTPSPTATSRWRRWRPRRSPPCTCRASPRRSCCG